MDIVERLRVYQQILDLQQRHPNVALGVLTTWSSAEASKDGSMNFNQFHEVRNDFGSELYNNSGQSLDRFWERNLVGLFSLQN